MSRYIVQPMLGACGVPYYVVVDTATDHGVEGYGCATWARHWANPPRLPMPTNACRSWTAT